MVRALSTLAERLRPKLAGYQGAQMAGYSGAIDNLERSKFYEGAVSRLARTYAAQMEALRKHRGNGTQTVRHVHVNEGGQAVVADTVNHFRRGGADGQIDD